MPPNTCMRCCKDCYIQPHRFASRPVLHGACLLSNNLRGVAPDLLLRSKAWQTFRSCCVGGGSASRLRSVKTGSGGARVWDCAPGCCPVASPAPTKSLAKPEVGLEQPFAVKPCSISAQRTALPPPQPALAAHISAQWKRVRNLAATVPHSSTRYAHSSGEAPRWVASEERRFAHVHAQAVAVTAVKSQRPTHACFSTPLRPCPFQQRSIAQRASYLPQGRRAPHVLVAGALLPRPSARGACRPSTFSAPRGGV